MDLITLVRGAIDKPAIWTAKRQSYLIGFAACAAMGAMVYEGVVLGQNQYLMSFLLAALFTVAVLTCDRAYWLRVLWLFGLGAAFGYALSVCELWQWNTLEGTHWFMLPLWSMAAICTYGIGAMLARLMWTGGEWVRLDEPGALPVLVTIAAIAVLVAIGY